MSTHTLCFCPLTRKLQAFETLKVNGESRGHPISPVKYNLYFHCSENTTFYIFTVVKYSFLEHALYLIHIFLYFYTLYIINIPYIS